MKTFTNIEAWFKFRKKFYGTDTVESYLNLIDDPVLAPTTELDLIGFIHSRYDRARLAIACEGINNAASEEAMEIEKCLMLLGFMDVCPEQAAAPTLFKAFLLMQKVMNVEVSVDDCNEIAADRQLEDDLAEYM